MNIMSEKRKNSETTETSKKQKSELIDQLMLKKQESIFKDMNFHEPVDRETFIKLMHSKQLLTEMPPDASGKWVEMKKALGLENEFKQFFKLYKKMDSKGNVCVHYNASKHGWGRVSPVEDCLWAWYDVKLVIQSQKTYTTTMT